ncbi:SUKH-4 family immunity protein [Actinocatenispora comari]|uniref:SUKH-4 immunity protein of toxin-antitoxin system n=1 Tax=Actinocatenispora comari TaxID=2807577 RepID=A0A8J4ACL6_9ACTN|nr:SUKH-4 family immunity protein [Actinocatenispora comari]GIL26238.1 hypothetical protein NUM_14920 [Actinocatenispora comari]
MDDAALVALFAGSAGCPYPGEWQAAPLAERSVDGVPHAIVALDPGISALGVRRDDGSLWILPDEDQPDLVNSSVEAFVAFTHEYAKADAEAQAYESDEADEADEAEQAADRFTDALLARFRERDAPAVADENSFWSIAAEELGYGISV